MDVEVNSLEEAKDVLYKKLKTLDLDIGDMNGFEVPENEDDK